MGQPDWLPSTDTGLESFIVGFSGKLSATPAAYGVTPSDAAQLAGLAASFVSALAAATDPLTRTRGKVALKTSARGALTTTCRALARKIQATATVTPAQKADLALPAHATKLSPGNAPQVPPALNLVDLKVRAHTIRLGNSDAPSRRARPAGVLGAEVYSFISDDASVTPPADLRRWRFEGLATRLDFQIAYDPEDTGKLATIQARWFNRRGQTGPVSEQLSARVAA